MIDARAKFKQNVYAGHTLQARPTDALAGVTRVPFATGTSSQT